MRITGIILAGGKSSRMGSDKGLLPVNGQPMIQHIINTLEFMGVPIIIIANNADYEQFGYPVFKDLIDEKGPIGGIYTALNHTSTEKNLIISCDTPYVSEEVLHILINQSEGHVVTIPEFHGRQHPLIGVYHKEGLPVYKSHLDKDELKLQKANSALKAHIVSMDEQPRVMAMMFNNINTQEELKLLEL